MHIHYFKKISGLQQSKKHKRTVKSSLRCFFLQVTDSVVGRSQSPGMFIYHNEREEANISGEVGLFMLNLFEYFLSSESYITKWCAFGDDSRCFFPHDLLWNLTQSVKFQIKFQSLLLLWAMLKFLSISICLSLMSTLGRYVYANNL